MKMLVAAALLITLPAVVVIISFFGNRMMFPALASLFVGSLPFIVGGLLLRKSNSEDFGGH